MKLAKVVVGVGVVATLDGASGFADPPAPDQTPAFVTLDRMDASSRLGVELSYVNHGTWPGRGDPYDNPNNKQLELYGQYIPRSPWRTIAMGGYAQLPVALASPGGTGDAEIGGLVAIHNCAGIGVVMHAGVTLPIGTMYYAESYAPLGRTTDIYDSLPQGLSFRIGVSPTVHRGRWFARGDVGIDKNLSMRAEENEKEDPFLRLNAAVGVEFGQLVLSAENTNIQEFHGHLDWVVMGALAVRYRYGALQPYAAVVLPLGSSDYSYYSHFDFNFSVTAGFAITTPQ